MRWLDHAAFVLLIFTSLKRLSEIAIEATLGVELCWLPSTRIPKRGICAKLLKRRNVHRSLACHHIAVVRTANNVVQDRPTRSLMSESCIHTGGQQKKRRHEKGEKEREYVGMFETSVVSAGFRCFMTVIGLFPRVPV